MTVRRVELGKKGEDMAVRHLNELGYKILRRNYKCSIGEIDIIAQDKDVVVFIEVRLKTTDRFGMPEESVTYRKAWKIRRVAEYYLKESGEKIGQKYRFDFFGIYMRTANQSVIQHIKEAF